MPAANPTDASATQNGHRPWDEPIAVIGMGGVFPDAPNLDAFWENLRGGRCSIREVPPSRWDPAYYHSVDRSAPDKTYSRIGAFVEGFQLDWKKFRIPPNVLRSMDAAQVWALEAADQALRSSGYHERPFDRSRCAVILGACGSEETRTPTAVRIMYPYIRQALLETEEAGRLSPEQRERLVTQFEQRFKQGLPPVTEDSMPGELSNIIAGRIANVFNLGGKNFTTDAACASSLAAVDTAVHALRSHECDLVLTGGADHNQGVTMYVKFSKIGALSANGCFPFDERADGFVLGEGAGMLLLKRFADARRDGDTIHAVIRGIGSSSDGRGRAVTAPNPTGQLQAIRRAYAASGLDRPDVDYVECHGTGTLVGDAAEVTALTEVFGPHVARPQSIPIGSVKSNIGHAVSAAGIASLLKAILSLKNRTLAPSLGFRTPSPHLNLERSPFYVNTEARPWTPVGDRGVRRAGVSGFGFGGTNFHLVLEEAPRDGASR